MSPPIKPAGGLAHRAAAAALADSEQLAAASRGNVNPSKRRNPRVKVVPVEAGSLRL
jgi:hypothetical protein